MKVTKFTNPNIKVNWSLSKYKFNPDKKVSVGQKKIQDFLLNYIDPSFIYQESRIPGSLKRFDLLILNKLLIIEYSPKSHHNEFNPFFHRGSRLNFLNTIKSDIKKIEWAELNGFRILELDEKDEDNLSYDYFVEKFDLFL